MSKLRWAIIGSGFISNTIVEAIGQSEGSIVELVAGRNPERLEAFRAAHQIPRSMQSFEDAVRDESVDAVYIGLPNHMHHEVAVAAVAAGKAVLSEKSLTTTMESANALIGGVSGRSFFVEGLMYLAHPLYQTVVDLLEDGRLGALQSVSGRYSADIWEVVNPAGRGTIYNLGCYPASLLHLVVQTMCGDDAFMDRVTSGAGNLAPDGTVGDAALLVRFGNGVLANLHSTDNYGMSHGFSIIGDRGVLTFETNPWLPGAGANVLTWTAYDSAPETIVVEDPHDAFYHQIKLVERGVINGQLEAERPSPRLQDSLEIMSLLTEWEAHCL